MAVIWGLDLREMQWGKFKSSYMFNRVYHLRRSKMIVYQLAMMCCVCSESVGTAAIADYIQQQSFIQKLSPTDRANVHNDDVVGAASFNIFAGIAVAFIFGSAFFFDLFWPERRETRGVKWAWKICSVAVTVITLASALTMTVIVARNKAYITGVDAATAQQYFRLSRTPSSVYRHDPKCVTSVVLMWLGWAATLASTAILFASHRHDELYGPRSTHARNLDKEQGVDGTGT